ncbi:hypothetical protein D3C85_1816330 [compost metagenome]
MNKEAVTRITLSIILFALSYTVYTYPFAFTFIMLVAIYALMTGVIRIISSKG